jgi:heptosyltransferase-2/heptosyltransferase-3
MTELHDRSIPAPAGSVEWPLRGEARALRDARALAGLPPRPLRPVVFYFCRMGDMVMLTVLLRRLHRRYRLPSYVVGAGSWNDSVFKGNPDVARAWSLGRHVPFLFSGAWLELRRALRDSAPGPVYVCEEHYRQLPRIRRMLALAGVDPSRCVFMGDEARRAPEHLIDRLNRLASRTPAALRASDYPEAGGQHAEGPRLYVSDEEQVRCEAWLRSRGWSGRELILLQPGNHRSMSRRRGRWRRTGADDKAWPLERWVALLEKLQAHRPEALLVLRGSVEEVPMLEAIRAAAGLKRVVVAGEHLREFFALCARGHSMISVDTGPAHAAAALGLPLVVLFGAPLARHWGPRSPSGSPVIGVGGQGSWTRVDQIPVEAVFEAWCALMRPPEHAPASAPAPPASPAGAAPPAGHEAVR